MPIFLTEGGIITCRSDMQPLNALFGINIVLFEILMDVELIKTPLPNPQWIVLNSISVIGQP